MQTNTLKQVNRNYRDLGKRLAEYNREELEVTDADLAYEISCKLNEIDRLNRQLAQLQNQLIEAQADLESIQEPLISVKSQPKQVWLTVKAYAKAYHKAPSTIYGYVAQGRVISQQTCEGGSIRILDAPPSPSAHQLKSRKS